MGLYRASSRSVGLSPFCTARHGAIDAATLNTSVRVIWAWRYVRLCLAKYSSTLVGKYRQTHRQLRARVYCQLHQQLHHELNLALYRNLDPSLYRELFATSYQSLFQQLFAALFGSMLKSKSKQLLAPLRLAICRKRLPGRRPVGRGVGGRIVVRHVADTTYCGSPGLPDVGLKRPRCPGVLAGR